MIKKVNEIGSEGATEIAKSLETNTTLQSIQLHCNYSSILYSLEGNDAGNEGATAFAQLLDKNEKLVLIGLSKNFIGDEGATAIAKTLCTNSTLQTLSLRCMCFYFVFNFEKPIVSKKLAQLR